MERLTKRLNGGKALCIEACEKECTEGHCECHKCEPFVDVLKRLAEYEDTELTTGQIAELDKLYLAKCEEVNQLRAELERLKGNSSGAQGDLISRSAAIDVIWDVFNQYCNDSDRFDEYETEAINRAFKRLQSTLEKQPTAYDVEKVLQSIEGLPVQCFLGVDHIPRTATINMINRNGSCELPEPVPWDKLSGDYIRGYTKAIQDLHQIMLSIYDNFKRCKIRWSERILHEIFNCALAHRAEIREGTGGFIRWNVPLKKVEWYAPDIVRSGGKE